MYEHAYDFWITIPGKMRIVRRRSSREVSHMRTNAFYKRTRGPIKGTRGIEDCGWISSN